MPFGITFALWAPKLIYLPKWPLAVREISWEAFKVQLSWKYFWGYSTRKGLQICQREIRACEQTFEQTTSRSRSFVHRVQRTYREKVDWDLKDYEWRSLLGVDGRPQDALYAGRACDWRCFGFEPLRLLGTQIAWASQIQSIQGLALLDWGLQGLAEGAIAWSRDLAVTAARKDQWMWIA